jgi:hypothetical protein
VDTRTLHLQYLPKIDRRKAGFLQRVDEEKGSAVLRIVDGLHDHIDEQWDGLSPIGCLNNTMMTMGSKLHIPPMIASMPIPEQLPSFHFEEPNASLKLYVIED